MGRDRLLPELYSVGPKIDLFHMARRNISEPDRGDCQTLILLTPPSNVTALMLRRSVND
jgi:hypothetical protein